MPIEIVEGATAEAPIEVAFAYVGDRRNVPDWLFGVREFSPVGEQDHGLGAVFDTDVKVGVNVRTRLEVTEWVENRLITLDAVSGVKVRARWHFEPVDAEHTRVTGEITVHLPFGPAGKAMGRVMRPALAHAVKQTTKDLKAGIEATAREAR